MARNLGNLLSSEPCFILRYAPTRDKSNDSGFFATPNGTIWTSENPTISTFSPFWLSFAQWVHLQTEKPWYDNGFPHKNNEPTADNCINCRFSFGAEGGTWTHTLLPELDFESSASANSATPAHIKLGDLRRAAPEKIHRIHSTTKNAAWQERLSAYSTGA